MHHFEYFNQDDILQIHAATLQILETVGVDFMYEPARNVLSRGGCRVEGKRVFFPPKLVETQAAKAPSYFTLHARNPEKNIVIGKDHIVCGPCYGPPFVTDLDRGRREGTLIDYINLVKLGHAGDHLDLNGGMLTEPNDVPANRRNVEMLYASMRYSDKPFMGGAMGAEAARQSIDMASILFGVSRGKLADQPPMISILCSLTPLQYDERMLSAVMAYAEAGMPQLISSLSIAGATSPVTLEGTLVVQNAEILAGIVLTQMIREGTPVVFSGSSSVTAMRYGTLSVGSPEMAVNTAATAQMARFYGIPSRGGGAISDAKIPDGQAALESMMSQLTATLSGVHFMLHSVGILESYAAVSYEKFIMDLEICGMCKRIRQGEKINPERLALDIIQQAGPGGEYLTKAHTYNHFKTELYTPILEERNNFDDWSNKGGLAMEKRANAQWKRILESYEAPKLSADIDKELRHYIEKIH